MCCYVNARMFGLIGSGVKWGFWNGVYAPLMPREFEIGREIGDI